MLLDATDRVIDVCRMPSHSGESNVVTDIVRVARILSNSAAHRHWHSRAGELRDGQVSNVVNLDIETLNLANASAQSCTLRCTWKHERGCGRSREFVEQVDGNPTVVFLNFGTGLPQDCAAPNTGTADPSAKSGTYPSTPTDSMPMRAADARNRGIRRGRGKTLALHKPAHA
ncbi:MAG: hypothetical protein ACLVI6_06770 [Bifidobacterium bifidum]